MKCGMPGKPAGSKGPAFRNAGGAFNSPLRLLAKKIVRITSSGVALH